MVAARNPDELARLLWGNGLERWFAGRPGWRLGPPVLAERSVTFVALAQDRELRIRVEERDRVGLEVVPVDVATAPEAARELAAVLESAIARGLRLESDRRSRLPVVNHPAIQEAARRIELFVASGCNLHCSFCCESERIVRKDFMPWDELAAKLRGAAAAGVDVVQFMGGEATLHPRFADALQLCQDLGLGTYVITNLLRWQQDSFAEAVGPLLDEVMISMHAYGPDAGQLVTGARSWWDGFEQAAENARRTLQGRVRCSTVLTRHNVADLERIGDVLLSFEPASWVMGNAVPVVGTRTDVLADNLRLDELISMNERFMALSRRCAEAGCRLVFFAIPQCVLGPDLWDDSHDLVVGDQDLADDATSAVEDVTFWSRADYLAQARPVTLGRARSPRCEGCARESVCGGHFSEYFDRFGDSELRPVATPEPA